MAKMKYEWFALLQVCRRMVIESQVCNNIDELLSFSRPSFIGTNRNDDAPHNAKVSLKSDSASNGSMHSNDEVFAHENGHPTERVETSQSVSNFVSSGTLRFVLHFLMERQKKTNK